MHRDFYQIASKIEDALISQIDRAVALDRLADTELACGRHEQAEMHSRQVEEIRRIFPGQEKRCG